MPTKQPVALMRTKSKHDIAIEAALRLPLSWFLTPDGQNN
jgi:hypothetical protein